MKLLLQILFSFTIWFNLSATPAFSKVAFPSYAVSFPKADNQNQESDIKIGVCNFARSGISASCRTQSENSFSQKAVLWESYVLENRARETDVWGVKGAGKLGLLSKLDNFTNLKKWVGSLDEVADASLISKLDNYISANPSKLQKLEDVLNAPVLKNQEWKNLERVFDAFKKAESKGVSIGHKKFPAIDDEGSGSFVLKNAKQFQAEASGDAALSFEKAGVSFDNLDDAGKLIDRKYGHGASIFNEVDDGFGNKIISVINDTRRQSILKQAKSQIDAASGTPIKWEISTELGAKGIRQLFDLPINSAMKNIEVVYVPQIKIIP